MPPKGLWRFLETGPDCGTCFGWWDISKCDTRRGLKRAGVLEFALFHCSWQICYHHPVNEPRVVCWMTGDSLSSYLHPSHRQPANCQRGVWGHQLTANAVLRPEDTHTARTSHFGWAHSITLMRKNNELLSHYISRWSVMQQKLTKKATLENRLAEYPAPQNISTPSYIPNRNASKDVYKKNVSCITIHNRPNWK